MRSNRRIPFALLLVAVLMIQAAPALAASDLPDDGITVWNEDYTLAANESLEGDLIVFNGNALLEDDSLVEGSVVVWNGDAEVKGIVESDLVVSNGSIRLTGDARVEGNVVCTWNCSIEQDEGARVDGTIISGLDIPMPQPWFVTPGQPEVERGPRWPLPLSGWMAASREALRWGLKVLRGIASILVLSVVGGLVALIWPRQTARVARTVVEAPGPTLGIGLLATLAAAALITILAITICLALGAAMLAFALVAAGLFGWIAIGALVGERLLEAAGARDVAPMWAAGLGTLLVSAVTAALSIVPCIGILGALATIVVGSMGLGAVILTRFGTSPYVHKRPLVPAPAPEPAEAIRFDGTDDESPGSPVSGTDSVEPEEPGERSGNAGAVDEEGAAGS